MARLAPVLTFATVVVALLAGGAQTASAAAPTCAVPAAKTVRTGAISTFVPDCGPNYDPSGWSARYTITDPPDHGSVRIDYYIAITVRYLPEPGYQGPDAFTYTKTTPDGTSAPVTQSITVSPSANTAPACYGMGFTPKVRAGGERTLSVSCTDADGDPLTFSISTAPAHGTATLGTATPSGREVTVRPAAGYTGADSLQLTANDGRTTTAPFTISWQVIDGAANTAPVCTVPSSPVGVTRGLVSSPGLLCQDAEEDGYTLEVVTQPAHGRAEDGTFAIDAPFMGLARSVTYLPADNYVGPDAIGVRVKDQRGASSPTYTLPLSVQAPPAPFSPFCAPPQPITVRAGVPRDLGSACAYVAPGALEILSPPAHGTAQVVNGVIRYTPAAGYTGPDSVEYRVLSAGGAGPPVTQTLTVAVDANTAPSCSLGLTNRAAVMQPAEPVVRAGAPTGVDVSCTDSDGDAVNLAVSDPAHGSTGPFVAVPPGLYLTAAWAGTYTPDAGFTGFDAIDTTVTDGHGGTVHPTVGFVVRDSSFNSAPSCSAPYPGGVLIAGDDIELTSYCTDPEGDPVTLEVLQQPTRVQLRTFTLTAPGLLTATLRAPAGSAGTDAFVVRGVDGRGGTTAPMTVGVRVVPEPAPVDVDAARGESLGAAEAALPTPTRPATVRLTTLNEGRVRIGTRSGSAPDGYQAFGATFDITAPDAIPEAPLRLRFRFDASIVPTGTEISGITIFRNGSPVPACAAEGATPNPCVSSRKVLPSGDVEIVVLTVKASVWAFGLEAKSGTPSVDPPSGAPGPGPSGTFSGSSPQPQPEPQPQPTPPSLSLGALPKLRAALTKGLQVKLTSPYAGTARAKLTLDGKTAKRLRLSKGKPVAVATGTASAQAGRPTTITLRFTKAAKRALGKAKKATFTLQAGVNDGPVATKKVTLKR